MEPFANDPDVTRNSQGAPMWAGQPSSMGTPPQGAPMWAGQPSPVATPPQGTPAWAEQSSPVGTPPPPAWVGQSAALPVNVQATRLDRGSAWPALRFIARWLKIIAWIELVVGVISSLVIGTSLSALGSGLAAQGGGGGGLGGFGIVLTIYLLIGTAVGFILTFASAELILVFLAIEKNTRKSE